MCIQRYAEAQCGDKMVEIKEDEDEQICHREVFIIVDIKTYTADLATISGRCEGQEEEAGVPNRGQQCDVLFDAKTLCFRRRAEL